MPVLFGCEPNEITHWPDEISEKTKAYIGELGPGMMQQLSRLEHVYISFPEGKVRFYSTEIGGMDAAHIEQALERRGDNMSKDARFMLRSDEFTTLAAPESIDLVRLTVRDLGFLSGATMEQIYERAKNSG